MEPSHHRIDLDRQARFGFTCNRCRGCCRFKKIQLNPYEIARLAGNRSLSTTECIARYTTTGGTVLRSKPDGTCIFLDARGCAVHPDRPLVCRLYPLGRYVDFLGVETFAQGQLEEGCQGIVQEHATVARYLEEQGAVPFMHAADRYLDLLWFLLERIKDQEVDPARSAPLLETVRAVIDHGAGEGELSWIDMDRAVADYCRLTGLTVPESLEEKMALHIEAVRGWAA